MNPFQDVKIFKLRKNSTAWWGEKKGNSFEMKLFFYFLKDNASKRENRLIELQTALRLTRPVSRGKSRNLKPFYEHLGVKNSCFNLNFRQCSAFL